MFANRKEAGRKLADALRHLKEQRPCVLALPRGGVPVAYEVALALEAPLDLVLVRKIGAPQEPELAVAAVVDGVHAELVRNEELIAMLGVSETYLAREMARQLAEIERRRTAYLGDRPPVALAGRTALIVDDGIATGATIRAAILAVRRANPKRLVLAVPVAPPDTLERLRPEVDEIVCLEVHDPFRAIGGYYADFAQLDDATVRALMEKAPLDSGGETMRV